MKIYATLRFEDAKGTIAWLERAFGLETKALHEGEGGAVAHAELGWGDDRLMAGEAASDPFGGRTGVASLYLSCEDPDGLFARATAAGATVLYEPRDTDYGSREFGVRDPEGNAWSFGTYEPR